MRVLVINPGATSTKIAIYQDDQEVFSHKIDHDAAIFGKIDKITDQLALRLELITQVLREEGLYPLDIDCVIGRGGLLRPIESGTYLVDDDVQKDMWEGVNGEHASNLGTIMAAYFAKETHTKAYFCDPVSVDEMTPVAKISGYKGIERRSLFHALNQKAAARKAAQMLGKPYEELRMIMAHLGGGVSVGAHEGGKVVDVYNVKDEGAFAMDRTGGLPLELVIDLCHQYKYELKRVKSAFHKTGGVFSYLGTADLIAVEQRIAAGDKEAELVFEGLTYQLAKDIGAMYSVLKGRVDCLVITGGMANSKKLMAAIADYCGYIQKIIVLPGEFEMEAMAKNAAEAHAHGTAKKYRP